MIRKIGLLLLVVFVSFPNVLYGKGDVTHIEWAKMLMKTLAFENSPDYKQLKPDRIFQLLEKIPDESIKADTFGKSYNNPRLISQENGTTAVTATESSATVFYYIVVPKAQEVLVDAAVKGGSQYWTFTGVPTIITRTQVVMDTVNIGKVSFRRGGIKRLGVSIPRNGMLGSIKTDVMGESPILPKGGWEANRPLSQQDMAQTMVQALGWGGKLPLDSSADKIEVASKKKGKGKGGMEGYEYYYNDFSIKQDGFYSFFAKTELGKTRTVIVDDYIEEESRPLEPQLKDNRDYSLVCIYLKKGLHAMKLQWNVNRDPGNLVLKRRENSCEAYKRLFSETEVNVTGCLEGVNHKTADGNTVALKNVLLEEEPLKDYVSPPKEEEELPSRRSLSPIVPQEENKTR